MPWCAGCDRFLSPNTVLADGTCPHCHAARPTRRRSRAPGRRRGRRESAHPDAPVANGATHAADGVAAAETDDDHTPIPWHLWLLIAAVVTYPGYRVFEGLLLLAGSRTCALDRPSEPAPRLHRSRAWASAAAQRAVAQLG